MKWENVVIEGFKKFKTEENYNPIIPISIIGKCWRGREIEQLITRIILFEQVHLILRI